MRRIMMIVSAILLGSLATAAQSNQASDVPTHAAFNYDANYANDRAEIENLSARYMIAMDDYDGDAYAATFTPDAVLIDGGGVHRGRQQIHDRTANQVQTARSLKVTPGTTYRPRIQHNITNEVIEVNGDTATQVAYWIAFTNATPQKDTQILFQGHYLDHLVKVNGHWYFKQRQIFNESMSSGGSQRKLFYPELGETDPTTNEPVPATK